MGVWGAAILSSTTTIAEIETEVNTLTATNWNNAIALGKELIGDKLELLLTSKGIKVDESGGEVLLDVILNPTVFNRSSDYLVLSSIYEDLSQGMDGLYKIKAEKYDAKFTLKFAEDLERMNLDTNLDSAADIYRFSAVGELSR